MNAVALRRGAWIAIAGIAVLYAPMAAEYILQFFTPHAPRLWDHAYGSIVGDQQAFGPGSIAHDQSAPYSQYRWLMLCHTVLGSVALVLALFQISPSSRRTMSVHRWTGRIQVSLVVVSMVGAGLFLTLVGPSGAFGGPSYYVLLWSLALGTLASTLAGWLAIRLGHVATHRVFMLYAFAMLSTAPFLRLLIIVMGLAWPASTQRSIDWSAAAVLGILTGLGAATAASGVGGRPRTSPRPAPTSKAVVTIGAVGAAALISAYVSRFGGIDRATVTWFTALLLALIVTRQLAGRDHIAAWEWRRHHAALLLSLPLAGLSWASFSLTLNPLDSLYSALFTAPSFCLFLSIASVAITKRSIRRPLTSNAATPVAAHQP